MKIMIVHPNSEMRALLVQHLRAAPAAFQACIETRDGRGLSQQSIQRLVQGNYEAILLPLRLPFYGSLRLAALVHLTLSPTRLVLVSGTPLGEELLLRLFDRAVLGPFRPEDLSKAVWEGPPPRRNGVFAARQYVEAAMAELLREGRYLFSPTPAFARATRQYPDTCSPYWPSTPSLSARAACASMFHASTHRRDAAR